MEEYGQRDELVEGEFEIFDETKGKIKLVILIGVLHRLFTF